MKKNIKQKGFTLIELMVVMSIITFLSSIILVAVKDVRDNAKAKSFRSEINQFINALELFKNEKGYYPGEETVSNPFRYQKYFDGSLDQIVINEAPAAYGYENTLNKYMPTFPKLPDNISGVGFTYIKSRSGTSIWRKCFGDSNSYEPGYIIHIPVNQKGFEDWPYGQTTNSNGSYNSLYNAVRCFSLK